MISSDNKVEISENSKLFLHNGSDVYKDVILVGEIGSNSNKV